jgi:hypothetical protein
MQVARGSMLIGMSTDRPKSSRVSSLIAWRLARDLKGLPPERQKAVLDVLQKANQLRLARVAAAAAIEKAREEITYPVLERNVGIAPSPPDEVPPVYGAGLFPDLGQRELDLRQQPKPALRLVDRPRR